MRTIYTPNEIIIKGDIAEILLYDVKGKERARCIIDVEDVEKVKKYKWGVSKKRNNLYVVTRKEGKFISMPAVIMGIKSNCHIMVDHRSRNTLNNRKFNLRVCTLIENNRNVGKSKNNKSGHKGVSWSESGRKWRAKIVVNYKQIHLGCFRDKIKAALAYNKAAIEHYGEFACLNKV